MFSRVIYLGWTIAVLVRKAAESYVVGIFALGWVARRLGLGTCNAYLFAGICADRAIPAGASKVAAPAG